MSQTTAVSLPRQIWHFIVHLRWHYQLFILSGGYLMGGFLQVSMEWSSFLWQFLNVHLLLFGGATAFNSYWDKDEGAIGGLRHPPKMSSWMRPASLVLQVVGLGIATAAGVLFTAVYLVSFLFFWLYSTPLARWKGKPLLSLVAIGISTGTNSFLLGYLAAVVGKTPIGWQAAAAAVGVALVILSLYPTSQIYQMDEDSRRGDHTFAIRYGAKGVLRFFQVAFFSGILLLSFAIGSDNFIVGALFFLAGLFTGLWVRGMLKGISARDEDYERVMRIKYGTSLAFVLLLISGIVMKHLL